MYRTKDVEIISQNLDKLEDEAKTIYLNKYEPTIDESINVYKDIVEFIKDRKRIVYGGYAQNELIRAKKETDVFYREIDLADIEFYSPDPIGDLIDMCDMMYKKKYKYVEGKEGVHVETYKIFVNFKNYCDITYMPKDIYDNCPNIMVDGLLLSHPHFMLIDAFRVYSDPMTSYFRLRKTFTRTTKLISYYPLDDKMIHNMIEFEENSKKDVLRFIRHNIVHDSKLIVVGQYAFNQLMKMSQMPSTYLIDCHYIQLISSDYSKDVESITNKLKKKYPNVMKKSYYPFFQFLDRASEWYVDNVLVLRLYGSNNKCNVFRYSPKKRTNFGSFQLLLLYCTIHYNMGKIRKNKFNEKLYGTMLTRLIKARDTYLDKNNMTVLDKTIFQEFTMECIGEPKDLMRSSFIERANKKEQGKKMTFQYKPTGKPGKKPNFKFDNTSGNIKN